VWACKTTRLSSCVVKSTNLKGRYLDLKSMTSPSMMELISIVENKGTKELLKIVNEKIFITTTPTLITK
jgi:hypothetical protein